MPAVFINYRTGDEEATATLVEWELTRRFGTATPFRASSSIVPGTDYEAAIMLALRDSSVLLAVIGRRWLHAHDEHGRRLLDKRTDWPRREIIEAFRNRLTVIPVLVAGTPRLKPQQLPTPLRPLAQCQYLRYDHRTAKADLRQLGNHLTDILSNHSHPHDPHVTVPHGTADRARAGAAGRRAEAVSRLAELEPTRSRR